MLLFQDVKNQVVLITGGGGGVGKHLALNFARMNSKVVLWDINRDGKYDYNNLQGIPKVSSFSLCDSRKKNNRLMNEVD